MESTPSTTLYLREVYDYRYKSVREARGQVKKEPTKNAITARVTPRIEIGRRRVEGAFFLLSYQRLTAY